MCGEIHNLEEWQEFTPITKLEPCDEEMVRVYTQRSWKGTDYPEILCEECYSDYFHQILCPICRQPGDYCQGHGYEEEMEFGDCPICELPVCLAVESLLHCMGHDLTEFRKYDAKTEQ